MKRNLVGLWLVFFHIIGHAQMPSNYKITYEKKVNTVNLYKRWDAGKRGKFYIDSSVLTTNLLQSTYTKIENPNSIDGYFATHMMYSSTYINIKQNKQISQKEIADETFLLEDSIPKLKWKITPETRKILGFDCYKALTKFQDSIVIVAYFTEQLQAPIGPESIGGLPGTILGMVVPKIHTTWLAKSFQNLDATPVGELTIPNKGKQVNGASLEKIITDAFKDSDILDLIILRVLL